MNWQSTIRILDCPRFAEPFRDEIREDAEKLAAEKQLEIEFVCGHDIREEKLIEGIPEKRSRHPGLVYILSAMESCPTYKPWLDKNTSAICLKPDQARSIFIW
jgi:hypothetical protein